MTKSFWNFFNKRKEIPTWETRHLMKQREVQGRKLNFSENWMINIVKKVRNKIAYSKIWEFRRKAAISFELHIKNSRAFYYDEAEAADRTKKKYRCVLIHPYWGVDSSVIFPPFATSQHKQPTAACHLSLPLVTFCEREGREKRVVSPIARRRETAGWIRKLFATYQRDDYRARSEGTVMGSPLK